jgi:hypothetical protein
VKNISGTSGERDLSPENESLSPYIDSLPPVSQRLSPVETEDLSTKSSETGDTGDTGDTGVIFHYLLWRLISRFALIKYKSFFRYCININFILFT